MQLQAKLTKPKHLHAAAAAARNIPPHHPEGTTGEEAYSCYFEHMLKPFFDKGIVTAFMQRPRRRATCRHGCRTFAGWYHAWWSNGGSAAFDMLLMAVLLPEWDLQAAGKCATGRMARAEARRAGARRFGCQLAVTV